MKDKIGKGKYDKTMHLLKWHGGVWKRVCNWRKIETEITESLNVTCENCLNEIAAGRQTAPSQ